MSTTSYDSYGRVRTLTDPLGRVTTTSYTPATNEPTTAVTVTNAAGHTSTSTIEPGRGSILTATDPNQLVATSRYDGLGRRTQAWLPNRATTATPSVTHNPLDRALSEALYTSSDQISYNSQRPVTARITSHQGKSFSGSEFGAMGRRGKSPGQHSCRS